MPDVTGLTSAKTKGFDTSGQGAYLELAVEPSWKLRAGSTPVGVSVPVIFGLGTDGYYLHDGGGNDLLGYVSVGVQVTIPLPIPKTYGDWYLTGTATYMHLISDILQYADYGRDDKVIGTIGISFAY